MLGVDLYFSYICMFYLSFLQTPWVGVGQESHDIEGQGTQTGREQEQTDEDNDIDINFSLKFPTW